MTLMPDTTVTSSDLNLLDRAPIVDGATVSKPLIDQPGCKQILFAMDAGQAMSQHQAPFVATVQVLDGTLDFGVAGQVRSMAAHDWLVMPADTPHNVRATSRCRFLLTLVKEPRS